MTILPRSLQGRMLALSALATLVSLVIAGTIISGVLARVVTGGVDRRLDAQLALMASAVTPGGVDRARLSALQAALDAGAGWRWQVEGPDGSIGSSDLPKPAPPPPMPPPDRPRDHDREGDNRPGGPSPLDGRDRAGMAIHARQVTVATAKGPVILTAAAPRDVIARPLLGALAPLLLTLALLGALLSTAAIVQIRLGLRPVRALRDSLAAVRGGLALTVAEDQPDELRPLAEELNALIQDNDAALLTARTAAANLAHALKTPVATLALDLRDNPRLRQVERIDATIRHHLARARVGVSSRRPATRLAPAVDDLVATVMRLSPEHRVTVRTAIPAELSVAVDAGDLDELVGNLIENAVRHAATWISIIGGREDRRVRLSIADDGPGIRADDRARATQAGVRLDERGDGHGFGLSIVRELVELHGGRLHLDDHEQGGLIATVTLPLADRPG